MEEIWKNVKDSFFCNYYEVSNMGRIRSKSRVICRPDGIEYWKPERIISFRDNGIHPHKFVSLCVKINGVKHNKTVYVHKAVAEAFINKPSSKHIFVTHIDWNYNNNIISNLRWITASENSKRNIELYPKNGLTLKEYNVRTGYYESIKSPSRKFKKDMIRMRNEGLTLDAISLIFKCSIGTVSNIINS